MVNVVQQYLKKGAQIYIEGQLTTRKWKDEQSGQDKYSTEIILQGYNSTLKMLNTRVSNDLSGKDSQAISSEKPSSPLNDLDDEIPF